MSESKDCTPPPAGAFSWNELITKDAKASGAFYSKLFGWKPTPFSPPGAPAGNPPYNLWKMDGNEMGVGGMMQAQHPNAPTQWIPYVVVDDVAKSLAQAEKLGAKTCLPIMSIGEMGRIAVIQDPQGATIGMHEFPKQ